MQTPVQAVERAFRILECFASSSTPLTIDDVAQLARLPRATAYRLIHTLESDGYLLQDEKSFRLGKRVLGLGFARLSRQGFARSAKVVLDQLAVETGQTVVLAEPFSKTKISIVAVARSSGTLSVVVEVGQQVGTNETVLAKAVESTSGDLTIRVGKQIHVGKRIHVGKHGAEGAVQAVTVPVLSQDGQSIASLAIVMPAGRMGDTELVEAFGDTLQRAASQLGY